VKVSVVIPTYRRASILRGTLEALLLIEFPPEEYEIIVVDDGGDDETTDVVNDALSRDVHVELLVNPFQGVAAARNLGAAAGRGELVLFCDDDIRVRPEHLRLHLDTHASYRNALVGGDRWYSPTSLATLEATPFGRYRIELERTVLSARSEVHLDGTVVEADTLPGCDLSIERATFSQLGGFDESFIYTGVEDQDLSTRACRAGVRLIRNHAIEVLHEDQTTTLARFGEREERGAHTVVRLTQKFPEFLGEFHRNEPVTRSDEPALIASKVAKAGLSRPGPLRWLHGLARVTERAGASDRQLWRLYRIVIGLHIFRGYRNGLRQQSSLPRRDVRHWRTVMRRAARRRGAR
jgi:glycosyltransferase involved in cell wall biosynthesis